MNLQDTGAQPEAVKKTDTKCTSPNPVLSCTVHDVVIFKYLVSKCLALTNTRLVRVSNHDDPRAARAARHERYSGALKVLR
jgi:hypothetical protein